MAESDWFQPYMLGVPLIDAGHRSLFELVHRRRDCLGQESCVEELGEAIGFLYHYVGAHFSREEQLMKERCYPNYPQHKAVHYQLKKVVYAIRQVFHADPARVDREKLQQLLENWLKEHIQKMDMDIVPYINGPLGQTLEDCSAYPALEQVPPDVETTEVTLKVPKNRREVIERCASILLHASPEIHDLEELALSAVGLSMEEAEELAAAVRVGEEQGG